MRTPGNIRQKLKQVKHRHLSKLLKKRLSPHPANCEHNGRVEIPDNGTPHDPLHICMFKAEGHSGGVCDAKHAGVERAQGCPYFNPQKGKDSIKAEFRSFFDTANHGEIAYLYPDVAALIWALDGDDDEDEDTEEEPLTEPEAELPHAPSMKMVQALDPESEDDEAVVAELNRATAALRSAVDDLPTTVERLVRDQFTGQAETLLSDVSTKLDNAVAAAVNLVVDARPAPPSAEDRAAEIRQVVESLQPPAPPVPISWWGRLFGGR